MKPEPYSGSTWLLLIFLLCCIMMVFSCSDDTENEGPVGVIIPLDVGNLWNYHLYSSAGDGPFSMEVQNSDVMNGTEVYYVVYSGFFYSSYWMMLAHLGEGLFSLGDATRGELNYAELVCPFEVSPGMSWSTTNFGTTTSWTIIATDQEITIPAGTFSCIYIQEKVNGIFIDHWWYPGIGEIKRVNNYASTSFELMSYSITTDT